MLYIIIGLVSHYGTKHQILFCTPNKFSHDMMLILYKTFALVYRITPDSDVLRRFSVRENILFQKAGMKLRTGNRV